MDRIIQAYGFKTKSEFTYHLETSASNLSSRYKKDLLPSDDTLDKLERLATLKEKGVITEQELIELKAKLI